LLFKGDIYALGLVFWEIVNRVEKRREKEEEEERIYQPPYWDMVGIDPSLDEMRKVRRIQGAPDPTVNEFNVKLLWKTIV
jgi:hypothetical protein